MAQSTGDKDLDRGFDQLQEETPDWLCRTLAWLRDPKARKVRLPVGIAFIVASFFWFLPVIGLELLPIGLMVIALDVPVLRKPVGRMMLWLEDKWRTLRRKWRRMRR